VLEETTMTDSIDNTDSTESGAFKGKLPLPQPSSPASLDEKVLAYARENVPHTQSWWQSYWIRGLSAAGIAGLAVLIALPQAPQAPLVAEKVSDAASELHTEAASTTSKPMSASRDTLPTPSPVAKTASKATSIAAAKPENVQTRQYAREDAMGLSSAVSKPVQIQRAKKASEKEHKLEPRKQQRSIVNQDMLADAMEAKDQEENAEQSRLSEVARPTKFTFPVAAPTKINTVRAPSLTLPTVTNQKEAEEAVEFCLTLHNNSVGVIERLCYQHILDSCKECDLPPTLDDAKRERWSRQSKP